MLYNLAEGIAIGATLLSSFMPKTAEKILAQIGTAAIDYDELDRLGHIAAGTKVTETPEILFARLDPKDVLAKAAEIAEKQAAAAGAPAADEAAGDAAKNGAAEEAVEEAGPIHVEPKEEITYDDFAKLQFVIGTIEKCEEVPKSKKLLCSQVRIGDQVRQIVSGIKKWYSPEDMVGRQVMVLLNLKPAKLAGLMSEGMILCAEDDEGNVILMQPEKEVKDGSEVC